jgi:hypothetical protein
MSFFQILTYFQLSIPKLARQASALIRAIRLNLPIANECEQGDFSPNVPELAGAFREVTDSLHQLQRRLQAHPQTAQKMGGLPKALEQVYFTVNLLLNHCGWNESMLLGGKVPILSKKIRPLPVARLTTFAYDVQNMNVMVQRCDPDPLLAGHLQALDKIAGGGQLRTNEERLRIEESTQTVLFDGDRFPIEHLRAFRLFQELVKAHILGETPILREILAKRANDRARDPRPMKLFDDHLCPQLRTLIKSQKGPTGGLMIHFPPLG